MMLCSAQQILNKVALETLERFRIFRVLSQASKKPFEFLKSKSLAFNSETQSIFAKVYRRLSPKTQKMIVTSSGLEPPFSKLRYSSFTDAILRLVQHKSESLVFANIINRIRTNGCMYLRTSQSCQDHSRQKAKPIKFHDRQKIERPPTAP
jgi:hypothetical protein